MQEQEDKIKAEAVAAYSLPVPYNFIQASYDGPPTFSMDDFEGSMSEPLLFLSSFLTLLVKPQL